MSLRDQFLAEVEAFLEEAKMEPSAFGRDAMKDPNFVFDLRQDRSPNLRTIDKVRDFISQHRHGQAA